jgi:hypothetical protein
MRNIKTLRGLQDELAIAHAGLVLGPGYDLLKKFHPPSYRRLHALLLANVKNISARRSLPRGKRK